VEEEEDAESDLYDPDKIDEKPKQIVEEINNEEEEDVQMENGNPTFL